jgi:hypothetical protein
MWSHHHPLSLFRLYSCIRRTHFQVICIELFVKWKCAENQSLTNVTIFKISNSTSKIFKRLSQHLTKQNCRTLHYIKNVELIQIKKSIRDFYVTHNVNLGGFTIQLIWSTINIYFYIPLILIEFALLHVQSREVAFDSWHYQNYLSCSETSRAVCSQTHHVNVALVKVRLQEELWKIHVLYMAKEQWVMMRKHKTTLDQCGELLQKCNGAVQEVGKLFRIGGNL